MKPTYGHLLLIVGIGLMINQGCMAEDMGADYILKGKVISMNAEPLSRDGDAILRINTKENKKITIRLPAREQLCETTNVLDVFFKLKTNDAVEVFGKVTGRDEILVCGSPRYYLKKTDGEADSVLSGCESIIEQASQYYEPYQRQAYQRKNMLNECEKYVGKSCRGHQDCGSFPCVNDRCFIKPCKTDSDCPSLCGLNATPVPRFCTTIDVK